MFLFGKPTRQRLLEIHERATATEPTYQEVGATSGQNVPPGYRQSRHHVALGTGDALFQKAVEGLHRWRAHIGAGFEVVPGDLVESGATVVVAAQLGPVCAVAPCRVVTVVDESDRWGFAYATLPGHPEQGEESFMIERDSSGRATFRICAFSRPADVLGRVGAPVAHFVQDQATRRYLQAMVDFVA